jgi:hypothetical protein
MVVLGILIDRQLKTRGLYEEGRKVGCLKQTVRREDKDGSRL